MFSFISKNVLTRRTEMFSYKYSSSVLVRFISTDSNIHNSFVVSYLISNCGVSQQKAISALKTVSFKSPKKPNAVLAFFRENGFSNTQISKIIGAYPFFLSSSVEKTLKPKFEFFKSQGISGSDLVRIICRLPRLLTTSVKNRIIPHFDLMRSIVHTDANLLALLKRSPSVLTQDLRKDFLPNAALLQAEGVRDDFIVKLLISQPRVFLISTSRFSEIVKAVKKMKFDSERYVFLLAVHTFACLSRSSVEVKFDAYRKWGLSRDEVLRMFRQKPQTLMISEKNIMSTMNCFVNEMGYTPSYIVEHPAVMTYSLTKRITPRCSVIQILKTKGLVENAYSLYAFLVLTEELFLKKFVIKFEKAVPEVLTAYRGNGR